MFLLLIFLQASTFIFIFKAEASGYESLNDFSTPLAIHPFANCIYLPSAVLVLTQRADVFMYGPTDVNNMYAINYCN